jgi:8-oxo-dGTP pyrophosphatase MutT (NUDIX family)
MDAMPIRQAAVIPARAGRVCLVLASSGKRWITPKGHIERGQTAAETALQEAWEEAGLVGVLKKKPVGTYRYAKRGQVFHVKVFFMQVTKVANQWPEEKRRQRRWVKRDRILAHLTDPGLCRLIRRVIDKRSQARA